MFHNLLMHFLKICIYLKGCYTQRGGQTKEGEIFHLLVHLLKWPQSAQVGQTEAMSQELFMVSHLGAGIQALQPPSTFFPRHINREVEQLDVKLGKEVGENLEIQEGKLLYVPANALPLFRRFCPVHLTCRHYHLLKMHPFPKHLSWFPIAYKLKSKVLGIDSQPYAIWPHLHRKYMQISLYGKD